MRLSGNRLNRKMFRDIKKNLSQFITIFLMVMIGIMVYTTMLSYSGAMQKSGDKYYKENNLFDLEAFGENFTKEDLEKIKKSISIIMNSGVSYEFRTTLVKEFHTLEDMKALGELVKGSRILYLQKFVEREGCIQKGLHEVCEDLATQFRDILLEDINEVELRGY